MSDIDNPGAGCQVFATEVSGTEKIRLTQLAHATIRRFCHVLDIESGEVPEINVYLFRTFFQLKEQITEHGGPVSMVSQVQGDTWLEGNQAAGIFVEGRSIRATESLLQQVVFEALLKAVYLDQVPTWLAAGMEAYFGDGIMLDGELMVGWQDSKRVERIFEAKKKGELMPLPIVLATVDEHLEGWSELDPAQHLLFIDTAWSMVHFLWDKFPRPFDVDEFVERTKDGESPSDAFSAALDKLPMETFSEGWNLWVPTLEPNPITVILERLEIIGDWMATLAANSMLMAMESVDKLRVLAAQHGVKLYRAGQARILLSSAELYTYPDGNKAGIPERSFELLPPNSPGLPHCLRASGVSDLKGGDLTMVWYKNRKQELLWDFVFTVRPESAISESSTKV